MTKKEIEKLKKEGANLAILDKISSEKLRNISNATKQNPSDLLHAAIDIFEKFFGRQVVVKGEDKYDLKINAFKRYKKITNLN